MEELVRFKKVSRFKKHIEQKILERAPDDSRFLFWELSMCIKSEWSDGVNVMFDALGKFFLNILW
jgi:hypothetical protein